MGKIIIQEETIKNPISLIGKEAGVCWNGKDDTEHNYKRGLDCIKSNHGRTLEFPQIFFILDGYSARAIREFYTHNGGLPTRLQSSTRYIDYEHGFEFVTPPSIENNERAKIIYETRMEEITDDMRVLLEMGIPREDCAMMLPLAMTTKVVDRTNLRQLIDMSRQRMCSRAYWEFRNLMNDLLKALADYSDEWNTLVNEIKVFKPKCVDYGYCTEAKSCGRMPRKDD